MINYEMKILRFERINETKIIEYQDGKKTKTKEEKIVEPLDVFLSRVENSVNEFCNQGYKVINSNYTLPINSFFTGYISTYIVGKTDFDKAEFVFILQKEITTN